MTLFNSLTHHYRRLVGFMLGLFFGLAIPGAVPWWWVLIPLYPCVLIACIRAVIWVRWMWGYRHASDPHVDDAMDLDW